MKVKNINGTSDNTCECRSWLHHWQRFSGQSSIYCSVKNCLSYAEVGAHVQKGGLMIDNNWYIVPMCKSHNNMHGQVLEIGDAYNLVSANVRETCG